MCRSQGMEKKGRLGGFKKANSTIENNSIIIKT